MSQQQVQNLVQIGILVLVVALIVYRVYRQSREQRWAMSRLWMTPIIFALITIWSVYLDTVFGSMYAPFAAVAGAAVGFGIGMYQGNHTTVRVDKPGKAIFIKVTPIGIAIFLGVLALRFGIRFLAGGFGPQQAAANGMPVITPVEAIVGSGLLAVALGSITGLRYYVKRAYDAAPST